MIPPLPEILGCERQVHYSQLLPALRAVHGQHASLYTLHSIDGTTLEKQNASGGPSCILHDISYMRRTKLRVARFALLSHVFLVQAKSVLLIYGLREMFYRKVTLSGIKF